MKARPKGRRGLHPAFALGLLALGGWVFTANVLPQLRGKPVTIPPDSAPPAAPAGEIAPVAVQRTTGGRAACDLLGLYGPYTKGLKVRFSFQRPNHEVEVRPAQDSANSNEDQWQGELPTPHKVTFVMVGADYARAVVDGRVVGVGETLGNGTVVHITKDTVDLQVGQRTLTYDLRDPWPREYRAERQRRAAATDDSTTPAAPETPKSKS